MPNKVRLLIVDNDESYQYLLEKLTRSWGYQPVVARGQGRDLLEDARKQARKQRCQLAVVDMRLLDNSSRDDTSGIDLVPDLLPAVSIILSGYGDIPSVRKSAQKGAVTFIEKAELPEGLHEALDQQRARLCSAVHNVQIEPEEERDHIIKVMLEREADMLPDYQDQVDDLFGCLFSTSSRIRLERLMSDPVSSQMGSVPRPSSVVLKVYVDDRPQPLIVKLARAKKLLTEVENYNAYIFSWLKSGFVPQLIDHSTMWDLGGAVFNFLGTNEVQSFAHYYEAGDEQQIIGTMQHFFGQTWSGYYSEKKRQIMEDVSLFDLYCNVWGPKWYKEKLSGFCLPENFQIHPTLQLPNPVDWLRQAVEKDQLRVAKTAITVTHGDLHGDNLLVDDNLHAWVIDFERTGMGHILQDFIELEADMVMRLTCGQQEQGVHFDELCQALAASQTIDGLPTSLDGDPQGSRLLRVLSGLRHQAVLSTGINDARQYLIGLLFNTLFRATMASTFTGELYQLRALQLGSILCQRLEQWQDAAPQA